MLETITLVSLIPKANRTTFATAKEIPNRLYESVFLKVIKMFLSRNGNKVAIAKAKRKNINNTG